MPRTAPQSASKIHSVTNCRASRSNAVLSASRIEVARIRRIQSQSGPDLGGVLLTRRKLKAFWHDADDGALQAIEVGFAADDVGIACKNALPRTIRNVRYHLCSRRIVRWRYQPPRNSGHAQRFQQSAAHVRCRYAHRLGLAGEIRTCSDPRVQRCPGMRVPTKVQEFWSGSPETAQTSVRKRRKFRANADQLPGMRVRQRLKENGIDHGEYAGGGSDPKHQAKHRRGE